MFKYDYLQAKLHSIHSKSIIDENYKKLQKIPSIENLRKELFPEDKKLIPVNMLYSYLEKKFKNKIFKQINYISKFYNFKNKFINNMILRYEIDNVKLLISAHYGNCKKLEDLFEVELANTLDYQLIYENDISDVNNIKLILENTMFNFLIPDIEKKEEIFYIENSLDKFYYENLLDSLNTLSKHERENLYKIIIEEINWQNISWAFRAKIYYKKTFANIKDSFLSFHGLIPIEILEKIFELQFIPDEAKELLKKFPVNYLNVILESFDEEGNFDLPLLEENNLAKLMRLYTKYFFIENFNILPIISFIYIKKNEYYNVVKLIESIRYDLILERA